MNPPEHAMQSTTCHECGAQIDCSALLCPQCGSSMPHHDKHRLTLNQRARRVVGKGLGTIVMTIAWFALLMVVVMLVGTCMHKVFPS